MSRRELIDRIGRLQSLQEQESFILTGIFLSSEDLEMVRNDLTLDEPKTGAVGRFHNVPVFLMVDPPLFAEGRAFFEGIQYTFVRMDVVN